MKQPSFWSVFSLHSTNGANLMTTTAQLKQRSSQFYASLVCAALIFVSESAAAQSNTPFINRLSKFFANMLPPEVIIPILAFGLALGGLLLWTGHMSKGFFFLILGGGVIVGAATWLANQAVSLGAG